MRSESYGSVKVFSPEYDLDDIICSIHRGLEKLGSLLPLKRVVLFGSWATGRQTAASDVDLLVVYADPVRNDAHSLIRKAIDVRGLEAHVYSASEAEALGPVLKRMTEKGIEVAFAAANTSTANPDSARLATGGIGE